MTFRAAAEHAADVLALADMTMYDAKEAGRNQVAVLSEGDERGPRTAARLHWQSRIEAALADDRFELHLQPIMDIASGRISSAEVLLRLRDEGELVPPSRFIYIAERVGLMPQVDAWVVDNSLEHAGPDARATTTRRSSSRSTCRATPSATPTSRRPSSPRSRPTASTRRRSSSRSPRPRRSPTSRWRATFAERMTELGCAFALDDFGAGFGSFYYLKHLLFDYVKIDGEFVAHVHESAVDRTIMRSIVGIAHDLGKRTVAEFVSEPEILEVCREEGVDFAQGYLIGKPVPFDEFVLEFMPSAIGSAPND